VIWSRRIFLSRAIQRPLLWNSVWVRSGVYLCWTMLEYLRKVSSQTVHLTGARPVCTLWCSISFCFVMNRFSHTSHLRQTQHTFTVYFFSLLGHWWYELILYIESLYVELITLFRFYYPYFEFKISVPFLFPWSSFFSSFPLLLHRILYHILEYN
jgi:hypothetical protein